MTLSALNAPEVDVDIMGLGDQAAVKKLDFDSGRSWRNNTNIMVPVGHGMSEELFMNASGKNAGFS